MRLIEFTFQGFWHFIGMVIVIELVFINTLKLIKFIWNRFWRHWTIRKHGYPPAHCDADGDLKEEEEE
jgi:hypothetical protein